MRFAYLAFTVAALGLLTVRPAAAAEAENGPLYLVSYFEVAPDAAAQGAGIARQYAEASRKEAGNGEFEVFQEIERPSRFAILEAWRDKEAADAHNTGAAANAFREKLQPIMIGGFGVRPHGELSVAAAKSPLPREGIFVLTHVDVFPTFKDQAVELVKAQAEAARKDSGNVRYDVLQWNGHANHFTLVAVWRDRKAFDTGVTTAQNKQFRDKLTPLEGALYDERLYHALQ